MKLLNSNLSFKSNIDNVIDVEITEAINNGYTLSFSVVADSVSSFFNDNYIVEADDDYFDIARVLDYRKGSAVLMDIKCEHVSYRLNEEQYDREYFTEDGTPDYILGKILEETGFTAGTIEFDSVVTYSAQEKLSARALLMEFASLIGAEIKFNKFTISLLQKRGPTKGVEFKIGKNIKGIERDIDYKSKADGIPKVAYDVDIVELRTLPEYGNIEAFELGETIRLIDSDMNIDTEVRVVKYSYNPLRRIQSSVEIQNRFSTLSDTIYRIERNTVAKGKLYHGIRISAENGFEAIRSDGMARAYFNSDTLAMQAKNETGDMVDRIYFDPVEGNYKFTGNLHIVNTEGTAEVLINGSETTFRAEDENGNMRDRIYFDTLSGKYVFDGLLSATTIEAVSANIDVVVSDTIIVNNLYAKTGRIADLTVNHLLTGDFISGDDEIFYMDIEEDRCQFIQAFKTSDPLVQYTDSVGSLLYWESELQEYMTTDETEWPVMVPQYESSVVFSIKIEDHSDEVGPLRIPVMTFGRGSGVTPESSKGKIYKDRTGLVLEYASSSTGSLRNLRLTDQGTLVESENVELSARQLRNNLIVSNLSEAVHAEHGDIIYVLEGEI